MYKFDDTVRFEDAWGNLVTGYASFQEAVEAFKKGYDDIPQNVSLAIGDDNEGNRWYAIDHDPMALTSCSWSNIEALLKDESRAMLMLCIDIESEEE